PELSEPSRYAVSGSDTALIDLTEPAAEVSVKAQNGESVTAIVYAEPQVRSLHAEVATEAGANVRLVEVFAGTENTVAEVTADIADGAGFELIQLYLGGDTVSEINAELAGVRSSFRAEIGYLLNGDDKLDINLIARHAGKKSESEIEVKGVMSGRSQKTFKGTIDFQNGASGAKGAEREEVLLMDKTVRNKTVPLILCAEEDVEGSHGASVGRIDERHIFYMQSRGIPMNKIYELVARSKIDHILGLIGDEETVSRINNTLGRSDEDE
ncbi:MAG: SufD family Fe-S cluster assembly protein, partial [Ruminococcus sp.]|nr:SufD family Fe-S cluster assembly protein [Ruminococcus sp.]